MNLKEVLKGIDFSICKEEFNEMKKDTKNIVKILKENLKNKKIDADVFVGGSFAKNTLIKCEDYDIDIFVRFSLKTENLSKELMKIVEKIKGYKIEKIHGSRDYIKIYKDKKFIFEIIPVVKIRKPGDEKNVTDLSYFHVNYVKKKLGLKGIRELRIAKTFFKANGIYGAESYINGFSGYALECLIIYYKTFNRLLKELIKVKENEKLIIDIEKDYKNKKDIIIELNESKIKGPIILIDPTWRERNILAALGKDEFQKFQKVIEKFLKNPNKKYFIKRDIIPKLIEEEARRKGVDFLEIDIKTDRQRGDIAGTKLKKFSKFLIKKFEKRYTIYKSEFVYNCENNAKIYLIIKKRKEIIRRGPPVSMLKSVGEFKKENKNTFIKNKIYYSKIKIVESPREFLRVWKLANEKLIEDMGIIYFRVL